MDNFYKVKENFKKGIYNFSGKYEESRYNKSIILNKKGLKMKLDLYKQYVLRLNNRIQLELEIKFLKNVIDDSIIPDNI